jgi:hypothetical protein
MYIEKRYIFSDNGGLIKTITMEETPSEGKFFRYHRNLYTRTEYIRAWKALGIKNQSSFVKRLLSELENMKDEDFEIKLR